LRDGEDFPSAISRSSRSQRGASTLESPRKTIPEIGKFWNDVYVDIVMIDIAIMEGLLSISNQKRAKFSRVTQV
jgi:hypothetical protein